MTLTKIRVVQCGCKDNINLKTNQYASFIQQYLINNQV